MRRLLLNVVVDVDVVTNVVNGWEAVENERIVDLVEAANDWVHSALGLLCAKFHAIVIVHRVPEGGEACIEGSHREDVPVAGPDLYYHHDTFLIAIISPY